MKTEQNSSCKLWTEKEDNILLTNQTCPYIELMHYFPTRTIFALKARWHFLLLSLEHKPPKRKPWRVPDGYTRSAIESLTGSELVEMGFCKSNTQQKIDFGATYKSPKKPTPKPIEHKKRRKVSILWGLISWEG